MERRKFLSLCSLALGYIGFSCVSKKNPFPEKQKQSHRENLSVLRSKEIPFLQKGDKIAVVAPAYKSPKSFLPKLMKWINAQGFLLDLSYLDQTKEGLFSATDLQRTQSFQAALDDDQIKAIWCVRGGYGCVKIIDQLDFSNFQENPKWIIGYSDLTVFHSHIAANYQIPTIHSITAKECPSATANALKSLKEVLIGEKISYKLPSHKENKEGQAEGILVGGNLSVLYSLCGSESSLNSLDTSDKILFIEDIGEYLYHIDRMMMNLKRNGFFINLRGLVVGSMVELKDTPEPFGKSVNKIILDVISEYDFPVVFNFPAGHIKNNLALIFGKKINLMVEKEEVLLEYV